MRLPLLCAVAAIALHARGADDDNRLPGGGFEIPEVHGRTPLEKGGDLTHGGKGPEWISLEMRTNPGHGKLTAGLTDEMPRTGRQSFFVTFDHVDAAHQSAILTSNFIPVAANTEYLIDIWGRVDAKDPLTTMGRSAFLKIEIEFYAKDANESVGEPFFRVQPLPGPRDHDAVFFIDKWNDAGVRFTTPPDAVFAQVVLGWESGGDEGETTGTIFFDDLTLSGPPAPVPNLTPSPVQQPALETSGSAAVTGT